MFDWLKRLLQGTPRARKIQELEAYLTASDGSRMRGEVEFSAFDNGQWELDIEIDHPDGAPAGSMDLKIDGRSITTLTPGRFDETEHVLRSDRGDTLAVTPDVGMSVDVTISGGARLSGTFQLDR